MNNNNNNYNYHKKYVISLIIKNLIVNKIYSK